MVTSTTHTRDSSYLSPGRPLSQIYSVTGYTGYISMPLYSVIYQKRISVIYTHGNKITEKLHNLLLHWKVSSTISFVFSHEALVDLFGKFYQNISDLYFYESPCDSLPRPVVYQYQFTSKMSQAVCYLITLLIYSVNGLISADSDGELQFRVVRSQLSVNEGGIAPDLTPDNAMLPGHARIRDINKLSLH